jgi:hypothetical protein
MQIAVVDTAQGHSELVTDLAPKSARLPKPNVMGIGRTGDRVESKGSLREGLGRAYADFLTNAGR